jgi:AAA+ ATPase superfamily predicted ATPase
MKKYLVVILNILILNVGYAQTLSKNINMEFIDFVNSFDKEKTNEILDFGYVVKKNKPMTKEEALEFVYRSDDTTKLYCEEKIFSMETEEIFGTFMETYFPNKCLRIDMADYFLIVYSSYQCADPMGPQDLSSNFLHVLILDMGFNVRDSMIVYLGDGYGNSIITGLLNPVNSKIFLIQPFQNIFNKTMLEINRIRIIEKHAIIYIVDENLKFKVEREDDIVPRGNDLMKVLEKLGWKDLFLAKKI